MLCASLQAQPADILLGHYEVQIDYENIPGNPDAGWQFYVSFDEDNDFNDNEGITRLDPAMVRLVASPGTLIQITQPIKNASSTLGNVNDDIWLMPHTQETGMLYLGIRAVVDPGVFQTSIGGFFRPDPLGSIVLELVSVTGTGPDAGGYFATWEAAGSFGQTLEFHFDSSDGVDINDTDNDRLEPFPTNGHTHYNWGMTKPGTYEVTFKASGVISPVIPNADQHTSGQGAYTFVVPFSGVPDLTPVEREVDGNTIRPTANLLCYTEESGDISLGLAGDREIYEHGLAALLTLVYTIDGELYHTAVTQVTLDTAGLDSIISYAADAEFLELEATDLLNGELTMRLVSHEGPGDCLLFDPESVDTLGRHIPFDTRDGITANDVITFPIETPFALWWSFPESGIHRVTVQLAGKKAGTDEDITSKEITLVFLADLPIDYDYAAYAESFERQHGLTAGALSDAFEDFDKDGVLNGIEYQLFWHGFDPAAADAGLMPLPTFENGSWGLTFLRDTYKDDFRLQATSLSVGYSSELLDWDSWHTNTEVDFKPGGNVFETGVGVEALGRIMARRLDVVSATNELAFFRFELF